MAVQVRDLLPQDTEPLRELMRHLAETRGVDTRWVLLKKGFEEYFVSYLRDLLAAKDSFVKVAVDGRKLVGYVIAVKSREPPVLKHSRVASLSDVYVHPDHRGKGIARKLLDAVTAWAREQKLTAIDVSAFPQHPEEIQALKALGFEEYRIKLMMPVDGPA